ncbi:uncharacterized protein LOC111055472 [Nilaparvata lugens]|uniref:uncharacterized protein LOC111055472 n=1 Tax=Nilaparvata lugens TaxID=108931 RepID=UPI00193D0BD1|nr:uncharacterized protein LOC111055472 [Nilaparvata lugens]
MNNFLFNQADVENIRTILYSDGIAIFSGKKNTGDERILEIAEVKFLNAGDYTNLKFEGALQFDQSLGNSNLLPTELSETKIQDVNYILNDNELFRTTFTFPAQPGQPPNIGYTLEIGEPHPGMTSDEDKEGRRFQTLIRCNKLESERSIPQKVRNDVMRPKVISLRKGLIKNDVLPHEITDLDSYFEETGKKIWECKVLPQGTATLYRVQTRMKLKPDKKIEVIFYQNGVKIYEDYKDQRHLIEITSYFEKKTSKNEKKTSKNEKKTSKNNKPVFVQVKFEGLVILPSNDLKEKFMDDKGNFPHHLDKPIFQFSAISRETGVSYLVRSEFTTTIDNSAGGIVTCVKYSDQNTKQLTKQSRILVNKISDKCEPGMWLEIDRDTNDDILYETYEIWSCRNQNNSFSRVVNKMIMKGNVRVYYQDGVEVQRLILLNGEKFIQIKHERFLKREQRIKYIGRLQLEIQTLPGLEKMLSSPPFNIQVLGKEDEQQSPSPYQPSYIFTLDSMRYAAKLEKRSHGHNPPIGFSSQNDFLQTTFFKPKSSRIFQLGRFSNKLDYLNGAGTIECYVYTAANLRAMRYRTYPEDDKTKYNPRVAEYIDQKLYILTQDEFDEIFTIKEVRTWFCTDNIDEVIKVETVFETTMIPFAVRSANGVKVELEGEQNKELLRITETVYINIMNSKIYKFPQNDPNGKNDQKIKSPKIEKSTGKGCLGC